MIKPLNTPQLSAAKTRCGLQSIGDLLPRLIRQYEMQAEMMQRHAQPAGELPPTAAVAPIAPAVVNAIPVQQATFAWYE